MRWESWMDRSEIMSRIRGRGNLSTEVRLVSMLREQRISGWRRHKTFLKPGDGLRYVRPDFVFPKIRVILFVDGCFWHGCPICYRRPKTNVEYWGPKIRANIRRDATATKAMRRLGWTVMRIWE